MKVVKKTNEYTIFQKRSGRYAVENTKNKIINGEEKVKILLAEGLIKLAQAKPVVEETVEAAVEETVETTTEDAPAAE